MKKSTTLCILLCLLLALCGCRSPAAEAPGTETPELGGLPHESGTPVPDAAASPVIDWQSSYAEGLELLAAGEPAQAAACFENALALDGGQACVYLQLAEAYSQLSDWDKAWVTAQRGLAATGGEELQQWLHVQQQGCLERLLQNRFLSKVTTGPLLSSVGTSIYELPKSAYGYVQGAYADLDGDGAEEYVALFSQKDGLVLKAYTVGADAALQETVLGQVGALDYCSQLDGMLYYSPSLGQWCFALESSPVGAYTGAGGFAAALYTVSASACTCYESWEWNSLLSSAKEPQELQTELEAVDWPCSRYLSFRGSMAESLCWLLRVDVCLSGGETPVEYSRYLRFWSPEELEALS